MKNQNYAPISLALCFFYSVSLEVEDKVDCIKIYYTFHPNKKPV